MKSSILNVDVMSNSWKEEVKKKSSFAAVGRAKTTSNLYFYQYIYVARKLFYLMKNVVYFICDLHLMILWEVIIIFNFVQIVHNHNETIKYYASCFKQEKY